MTTEGADVRYQAAGSAAAPVDERTDIITGEGVGLVLPTVIPVVMPFSIGIAVAQTLATMNAVHELQPNDMLYSFVAVGALEAVRVHLADYRHGSHLRDGHCGLEKKLLVFAVDHENLHQLVLRNFDGFARAFAKLDLALTHDAEAFERFVQTRQERAFAGDKIFLWSGSGRAENAVLFHDDGHDLVAEVDMAANDILRAGVFHVANVCAVALTRKRKPRPSFFDMDGN